MNIKKVDDKPMVIHTKKKATLHIVKKKCKDKPKHKIKLASFAKTRRVKISNGYVNNPRLRKLKLDRKAREEALPKKKGTINTNVKNVSAVGVSAALNHMEGGNEVKEAAMVAYGVAQPVAGVTKKSSEIYRNGLRRMKKQRIRQVKAGAKISKREIKKKEYLLVNDKNEYVNTTAGVSNVETGAKANTSKASKSSARKRYAKSSDNSTVSPGSRLKIRQDTIGENSYFVIGTDFYKTTNNMPKGSEERTKFIAYSHDPLAKAAKKCGYDICWLDFSQIPEESVLKTEVSGYCYMGNFGENQITLLNRIIMRVFPYTYRIWGSPARMYDGMIFVTEAHPIQLR